jgi:hypothetical protein
MMRSNSGGGKSSNNTGNPTLEEHERTNKGVSGNAIHGEKKTKGSDRKRTDARIGTSTS